MIARSFIASNGGCGNPASATDRRLPCPHYSFIVDSVCQRNVYLARIVIRLGLYRDSPIDDQPRAWMQDLANLCTRHK